MGNVHEQSLEGAHLEMLTFPWPNLSPVGILKQQSRSLRWSACGEENADIGEQMQFVINELEVLDLPVLNDQFHINVQCTPRTC